MMTGESKKSHSLWWDCHITPKTSRLIAEDLWEVDQSVTEMLKLIEEDENSPSKKAEMRNEKRPKLISYVLEFYGMYRLLAKRYEHLTGVLRKNISLVLQIQCSDVSNTSDQASPLATPNQKLSLQKSGQETVGYDSFLSSAGSSSKSSSLLSPKSDSESFTSSIGKGSELPLSYNGKELQLLFDELETELPSITKEKDVDGALKKGENGSIETLLKQIVDYEEELRISNKKLRSLKEESSKFKHELKKNESDSDSFNSSIDKDSELPLSDNGKELHLLFDELETEFAGVTKEKNADGALMIGENGSIETLLKQIADFEEELSISNKKLQSLKEECARLKHNLKTNESTVVLMGNLQAQLESAEGYVKIWEANFEMEKNKVSALQKQVAELESELSYSNQKVKTLEEKFCLSKEEISNEVSGARQLQEQLESAQRDKKILEAELDSQRGQVLKLQEMISWYSESNGDEEIEGTYAAPSDSQTISSPEKMKFLDDISRLSEQQAVLVAIIEEQEEQIKSLENDIRQSETEKKNMKPLHDAQQASLKGDIEQLKAELSKSGELVEFSNNSVALKLKHDIVLVEKDGMNAEEKKSEDNKIQHLGQIPLERLGLIGESETTRKLVDELKLKVGELEREVDRQRLVILGRSEEKREAIRQLCFSLEHYRSGYKELRQAFIRHKQHVLFSP